MEGRRGEPAEHRMWTEPRPTTHQPGWGWRSSCCRLGTMTMGGALVCGGYCVALCHRDSWSFSDSDSGLQL